ncbi:nucleoside hydrolase [Aureliella helgolandensis]|uniref:Pyrimidine-specific ribonucleoside hydrolase RihB n=1 Tax=Aureliella helgolandensis TaxID=2527968 RepID=A0A518G8X7_9BACT|nr:nucleoside hydrolase [Aureliella helgolandensis]QDV25030.1 Pyrimidine-specific ribonucleoside hydrolase RihB [Aureliella helgolandensis]
MARKVIIDCDPGIDDAIGLCMALFDPRLEVVAITACAGTVDADQATQNVRALVENLDPPRMPRIGSALEAEAGAAVNNGTLLHGDDGLGNSNWLPISRQHSMPSDKLISDCLRTDPGKITIVTMGPLTGIAKAISRDPAIVPMVDRIVIAGGSVTGVGNVTATAEFNMHFDPLSARAVFQSATTKSLIPRELCDQLNFGWELVEKLPPNYMKVGKVLHQIVPHLCRTTRQHLGQETIELHAVLPILMLVEPMLFDWEEMAGDVEVNGDLTRGATVFDRRTPRKWRPNMEVATSLDADAIRDAFYNCLKFAAQNS